MSTELELSKPSAIQGLFPNVAISITGIQFTGDESESDMDQVFSFLATVSRASPWMWGDAITSLLGRDDIASRYQEIIRQSGLDEAKVKDSAYVASRIPHADRSERLSFTHHLTIIEELRRLDRMTPEIISGWIAWAETPMDPGKTTRPRTVTEVRVAIRQKYKQETGASISGVPSVTSIALRFRQLLNVAGELDTMQKASVVRDGWAICEQIIKFGMESDPSDLETRLRGAMGVQA